MLHVALPKKKKKSTPVLMVSCDDAILAGLCKVPAKQLEEKELRAYRKIEKDDMNKLLEQYLSYCRAFPKVR